MEDDQLKESIRNLALEVRMDQGEANLTGVLKSFLTEFPDMKVEIRKKLLLVKEIIKEVNSMGADEFSDLDIDSSELGEGASEYEMLTNLFTQEISKDNFLTDNILSLLIYGSYAKKLHIVGESDINFVLTLKNSKDDVIEKLIEKINEIAESIITPELSHIFDLMILRAEDLNNIEQFGEVFTYIHALFARDGEVLIGENPFKDKPEIDDEKIRSSAKLLILDCVARIEEIVKTANEEELPEEELEYLLGGSIVDIAFALCCFEVGMKCSEMDLIKPDIHEIFKEVYSKDKVMNGYFPLLQQAHAFKLSIKLPETENFIETSYKFVEAILEHTELVKKK